MFRLFFIWLDNVRFDLRFSTDTGFALMIAECLGK